MARLTGQPTPALPGVGTLTEFITPQNQAILRWLRGRKLLPGQFGMPAQPPTSPSLAEQFAPQGAEKIKEARAEGGARPFVPGLSKLATAGNLPPGLQQWLAQGRLPTGLQGRIAGLPLPGVTPTPAGVPVSAAGTVLPTTVSPLPSATAAPAVTSPLPTSTTRALAPLTSLSQPAATPQPTATVAPRSFTIIIGSKAKFPVTVTADQLARIGQKDPSVYGEIGLSGQDPYTQRLISALRAGRYGIARPQQALQYAAEQGLTQALQGQQDIESREFEVVKNQLTQQFGRLRTQAEENLSLRGLDMSGAYRQAMFQLDQEERDALSKVAIALRSKFLDRQSQLFQIALDYSGAIAASKKQRDSSGLFGALGTVIGAAISTFG